MFMRTNCKCKEDFGRKIEIGEKPYLLAGRAFLYVPFIAPPYVVSIYMSLT